MLYTVFNYVPILEEEVSSKKFEQRGGEASNDCEGEDGGDENPQGNEDLFRFSTPDYLYYRYKKTVYHHFLSENYLPPVKENCTPPPRVQA